MPDGVNAGANAFTGGSFVAHIAKYTGQTVTIYTKSGGESGSGFTGVILAVNCTFVRLLTRIGPPPGCSLGNACSNFTKGYGYKPTANVSPYSTVDDYANAHPRMTPGSVSPASEPGAFMAGGWDGYPVYTVGSVTDIPIDSIVSFVHSAV